MRLFHLTSHHVVPQSKSSNILKFLDHGKVEYVKFLYVDKEKKLINVRKWVSLPSMQPKQTSQNTISKN